MSVQPPSLESLSDPNLGLEQPFKLKPYGVGIDCHKAFIQVTVLVRQADGVGRCEAEFSTAWPELVRAREWIAEALRRHGGPDAAAEVQRGLQYTIESTGTYHMPVMRALGGRASVVNPLLANPSRRKTDVLDARLLAFHSITGMWPVSFIAEEPVQSLRVLVNMREDAKREALRAGNRINNFLLRYGHTVGATERITGPTGRAVVEDLLEGRVPRHAGVCPDGLPAPVRPVFAELYSQLDLAVERAARYEKAALREAEQVEFLLGTGELVPGARLRELLLTIPGFARLSTLYWMVEVVTPTRFPNAKALGAFAGCDPSLKVSAGKVTSYARRHGNKRLHIALTRAAQVLITLAREPLGAWGRRIWRANKAGGFKKACSAVARRMAEASWHVTMRGAPFDYSLYTYHQPKRYGDGAVDWSGFGGFARLLCAYATDAELAGAYEDGTLAQQKGIGVKCLATVKAYLRSREIPQRRTGSAAAASSSTALSAADGADTSGTTRGRSSTTGSSVRTARSPSPTGSRKRTTPSAAPSRSRCASASSSRSRARRCTG
jgi:transposase